MIFGRLGIGIGFCPRSAARPLMMLSPQRGSDSRTAYLHHRVLNGALAMIFGSRIAYHIRIHVPRLPPLALLHLTTANAVTLLGIAPPHMHGQRGAEPVVATTVIDADIGLPLAHARLL